MHFKSIGYITREGDDLDHLVFCEKYPFHYRNSHELIYS